MSEQTPPLAATFSVASVADRVEADRKQLAADVELLNAREFHVVMCKRPDGTRYEITPADIHAFAAVIRALESVKK